MANTHYSIAHEEKIETTVYYNAAKPSLRRAAQLITCQSANHPIGYGTLFRELEHRRADGHDVRTLVNYGPFLWRPNAWAILSGAVWPMHEPLRGLALASM